MFIVKLNTPQDKLEWPVTDQTPRILAAEGLGRPARECDRQSVWSHNQEEEDFFHDPAVLQIQLNRVQHCITAAYPAVKKRKISDNRLIVQ